MIERNTISLSLSTVADNGKDVETKALIDSGAGGKFIDQNFAKNFEMKKLDMPIKAYNVDGTENKKGTIQYSVDLAFHIDGHRFEETLLVTRLGKQKIILGFPWLNEHNPAINWKTGQIEWQKIYPA